MICGGRHMWWPKLAQEVWLSKALGETLGCVCSAVVILVLPGSSRVALSVRKYYL